MPLPHPSPENAIALVAMLGLAIAGAVVLLRWIFSGPRQPDPWGEQVSRELDSPNAAPVCHRCLTEQTEQAHFCPKCGTAVGAFNNWLPLEQLYSEGEVFRNGTNMNLPRRPLVVVGYLLISLAAYSIFAPAYWYFLFRNLFRRPASANLAATTD
jgi:hypothetical protein